LSSDRVEKHILKGITPVPKNKVSRLLNVACAYCGVRFGGSQKRVREHVIGLNFVPEHTIRANDWNLIVWACESCNSEKSDLEDEISAITLQPDLGMGIANSALAQLAARKAQKAMSRHTKKSIQDSHQQHSFTGELLSGVSVKFGMIGPPVILPERSRRLVWFHTQAFFYLKNYDRALRVSTFMPDIVWTANARRSDWGNTTFVSFADLTRTWQTYIQADAANGNFQIVIRQDSADVHQVWSFALEWNAAYRVIGFFGDAIPAKKYADSLPRPTMFHLDQTTRYREEIPIQSERDIMFE
jgi:hypothetical protein